MQSSRTTIRRSEICQGRVDNFLRYPADTTAAISTRDPPVTGQLRHSPEVFLSRWHDDLCCLSLWPGRDTQSEKQEGSEAGREGAIKIARSTIVMLAIHACTGSKDGRARNVALRTLNLQAQTPATPEAQTLQPEAAQWT